MKRNPLLNCLTGLAFFCLSATGFAITIDFEDLSDSAAVGGAYTGLGVTFSGATVLTSGISLNELDFPPRSGGNVVFDDGGPITGVFANPVDSFSAYLTYSDRVTLSAYDAGGSLIGSITSTFAENFVSSGNTPNELLVFNSAVGIKSFSFAGTSLGGSFTLDDFSFEPASSVSVPDAGSSLTLFAISMAGLQFFSRRFTRSR